MLLAVVSAALLFAQDGRGAAIDSIARSGLTRGAYPGAAVVIGRRESVLLQRGYGRLMWSASGAAVTADSTIYDLASLTKVVATTTAIMLLVERGKVVLDAPVSRYLPEVTGAPATTIRQLLNHTSGLRGTLPLHKETADRAAALARVFAESTVAAPGSRVIYSDLNAILLGEVVARAAGEPLETFVTREILAPLGMTQTLFRPPSRLRPRIAPTGVWRNTPVAGVVNDPNADRLGGVAGHAGLFGTAADVGRFAQFMLAGGVTSDGKRILKAETIRQFTTLAVPARGGNSARALGWQALPTDEEVSSAGKLFGPRSYGHTGWTGTSLWIDPDRDVFVVLLTNRAYAPRASKPFTILKHVRGGLADAAARAVDDR